MSSYNELIYQLSRKFNWETQVSALPAGNKLDSNYYPLSPDTSRLRADQSGKARRGEGAKPENNTSLEDFEVRLRGFVK